MLSSLSGGGAIGGGPTTTVVIAKQQIPLRHQITAADIEIAKASVNGNGSLSNTYSETSSVMGLISELNISKGAVITSDMLAKDISIVPTGAAPAYLPLAKGYVAMTIPTGELQGVAGHISVGDYMTVIVSAQLAVFKPSGVTATSVTKTVFWNLRVIGLGPASQGVTSASGTTTGNGGSATTGVTSSLTLEITQCDAEYFTWFLGNTQVRYTLESYKDYTTPPVDNGDPACATIQAAGGVTVKQVDARFHFSALA
ncbi:MAG TPA: Flp pilus assembly protein CpaB [Candidatus Limnocylindrales bacterium]|nr:Flp pilus assembly protein CpaB [Candidatus Limnocylindrales bacterium]